MLAKIRFRVQKGLRTRFICVKRTKTKEPLASLSPLGLSLQRLLVPLLEECVPSYGPEHVRVLSVLEVLHVERFVPGVRYGRGRPLCNRQALFRSFVAKSVLGLGTTRSLLRRLQSDDSLSLVCGFSHRNCVPTEATLSRAFDEFSKKGYAEAIHAALVAEAVGEGFAIDVSRDSTAIPAREAPLAKPKAVKGPKGKPGRKKGAAKRVAPPTRQERQLEQTWQEAVAELPSRCDVGAKKNSKGFNEYWTGYKLHVDVADDGFPLAAATTAASVHDSQVAIPLMKKTHERAQCCYNLMDKAYVGDPILAMAQRLGIVCVIAPKDTVARKAVPLSADKRLRFQARTTVERFFSALKDNYGADRIRVKGHLKVHFHLMTCLLAYAATLLLRT